MEFKIELPDEAGNVISIEVARQNYLARQLRKKCTHHRVTIDPVLTYLQCNDCGATLNPIEWLAMMAEQWGRVSRLYEQYRAAAEALDKKTRCKCQHCGKMTRVPGP